MRTAQERTPAHLGNTRHEAAMYRADGKRPVRSGHSIVKTALAAIAGLLLTAALTTTQAHASVTSAARASAVSAVHPDTFSGSCDGTNDDVSFWGYCGGSGPTSYRAIAYCYSEDYGNYGVFGVERWDGDTTDSAAHCSDDGLGGVLVENWGYVRCSNSDGQGAYDGYVNKHGDISGIIDDVGGTWLCDYDTSGQVAFSL